MVSIINQNYPGIFDAYIASDGKVYPETYYAEDKAYSEGSILKESFKNIWENKFKKLRALSIEDFDCPKCELFKKRIFCDFQFLNLSKNIYSSELRCGATPFVKKAMLQRFLLRHKISKTLPAEVASFIDNY